MHGQLTIFSIHAGGVAGKDQQGDALPSAPVQRNIIGNITRVGKLPVPTYRSGWVSSTKLHPTTGAGWVPAYATLHLL